MITIDGEIHQPAAMNLHTADFMDFESGTTSATGLYRVGLPSPRTQHFAGEVPPALSPLDAIAAHSRRLAKELEETRQAGERRMSRLPPHIVTASLNEHQANRPQIFRSLSDKTIEGGLTSPEREAPGTSPEVAQPKTRPVSSYPRISRVPEATQSEEEDNFHTPREENFPEDVQPKTSPNYFGSVRTASPERVETDRKSQGAETIRFVGATEPSVQRHQSTSSQPDLTFTLVSPNAAFARKKNHLRLHHESSDDDFASSNAGSTFSQRRQLSSNSGTSIPLSPVSPAVRHHARSPSNNSEGSEAASGFLRSRSNMNFSRPLSASSSQKFRTESPTRKQSVRSQNTQQSLPSFDMPRTPTSFDDTQSEVSEGHMSGPAPSYTYGKFSLPRGRKFLRDSVIFSGLSTPHFEWLEPLFSSTPPLRAMSEAGLDTPSPTATGRTAKSFETDPGRPSTSEFSFDFNADKEVSQNAPPAADNTFSRSDSTRSAKSRDSSVARPSIECMVTAPPIMPPLPLSNTYVNSRSSRSNSTIRPLTARTTTTTNYQTLTDDERVSKAIELHQNGDLKESTYHLRIAAKQGHPTAMLLYALACRHGWGMRPNMPEGVQWLRKAVDHAMLEVADDENPANEETTRDFNEKKAHRAQFALGIYELGVSHLRGWGVEQDKALALRCFEIAGNWGDVDALNEAGFCYAQGVGCKKDLRKAAKLYRSAADKGASMVGNSWIYKEKYDEDNTNRKSRGRDNENGEKKPRNKSRTRSIFARKKSFQP